MPYSVKEIASAIEANLVNKDADSSILVERIFIDSRLAVSPGNSMFVALKTLRNDGHRFIPELYSKGIGIYLVNNDFEIPTSYKDTLFLKVADTLDAIQKLAQWHRNHFKLRVIGITGSNGKTIVKEWLYQLLYQDKKIVRSPLSFNSQIGVPLSVLLIRPEHELGIYEAGISMPGEMEKLEPIIQPAIGLFTNIGEAHGINFSNQQEKVRQKLKLFKGVKKLIYCSDYTLIDKEIKNTHFHPSIQLFNWSKTGDAPLRIVNIRKTNSETMVTAKHANKDSTIRLPFIDDVSIENAIHCWALLLSEQMDERTIAERMKHLQPVSMRMEMLKGINNCTVINDVYNSDLDSLHAALDFLNIQEQHENKTIILSDLLQSGREEKELYHKVSALVGTIKPKRFIGIGNALIRNSALFGTDNNFFNTTEEFINHLHKFNFRNETILIKGSRFFEMEKIVKLLEQQTHETVLEIKLNALVHNLNYFKSQLNPSVKIMVMVKAFSYGSGSFEIANTLQYYKTDYLAVAYIDEGIELRNAGIYLPIMVMNSEPSGFEALLRYNLEPEIFSLGMLHQISNAVMKESYPYPIPIHIKIDTGMHRLGFDINDIPELLNIIRNAPHLKVQSVFSHLAGSDSEEHKVFTQHQIEIFKNAGGMIQNALPYPVLRHIVNSAGALRYPEAQFDMVRLGIGLYGILPGYEEQNKLENVSALKTTISQIKQLRKTETIGYNRKGVLSRDSTIATVAIGYADGLSRALGNKKGLMRLHGVPVPIIGDVCMDMCMLDITGIAAKEGDEVIVFDSVADILKLSSASDTIPYELLSGLSGRVKRVYFLE